VAEIRAIMQETMACEVRCS